MMNRSVMQRQMFRKGGAAFPDLSGDGKITQKDILMGRGVIPTPKQYGGAVGMQQGGVAPPMMPPPAPAMMPPPPPMPPDPAMMPPPPQMDNLDPAVLEGMMGAAAEGIQSLDQAQDYEQVMNTIRGDEASIGERRDELASVVGERDADQTPESVLTLVQPVMQMAQSGVDLGIGALAQDQMAGDVQGPMAEGIMSTVDMGMEEAPPVNFNQGGPVLPMKNGGEIKYMSQGGLGGRLGDIFREKQALYESVAGTDPQALQDQKNMTQAQMLFDIANTALAFASPMPNEPMGLSGAERLALAAQGTQLFDKIGTRGQQLEAFKQAQEKDRRALSLGALQAAESQLATEKAAAASAAKSSKELGITDKDYFDKYGMTEAEFNALSEADKRKLRGLTDEVKTLTDVDYFEKYGMTKDEFNSLPEEDKRELQGFKIPTKITDKDYFDKYGMTKDAFNLLSKEEKNILYGIVDKSLSDKDYFIKYGMTKLQFNNLSQDQKDQLRGLANNKITDKDYFDKFGLSKSEFDALTQDQKNVLRGVAVGPKEFFAKFGIRIEDFNKLTQDQKLKKLNIVPSDKDFFNKFGMTEAAFNALPEKQQKILQGIIDKEDKITDKDFFSKFGMTETQFNKLPEEERNKLLKIKQDETAWNNSNLGYALRILGDEELFTKWADNKASDTEITMMIFALDIATKTQSYFDTKLNKYVTTPGLASFGPVVMNALEKVAKRDPNYKYLLQFFPQKKAQGGVVGMENGGDPELVREGIPTNNENVGDTLLENQENTLSLEKSSEFNIPTSLFERVIKKEVQPEPEVVVKTNPNTGKEEVNLNSPLFQNKITLGDDTDYKHIVDLTGPAPQKIGKRIAHFFHKFFYDIGLANPPSPEIDRAEQALKTLKTDLTAAYTDLTALDALEQPMGGNRLKMVQLQIADELEPLKISIFNSPLDLEAFVNVQINKLGSKASLLQKRFVDNPELYDEQSKLMARTAYDKSVELLQELVELKKGLEGIRTVSDEDKQKRMRAKNLDPNLINKKFQEQYGNTQSSGEATN